MPRAAPSSWFVVCALVLTGAGLTIAGLWAELPRQTAQTPRTTPPAAATPASSERAPAPQPPQPIAEAFPSTQSTSTEALPLILTGTIRGRNRHEGTAFIGTDERNPQTYVAGAILANGARLTQIDADSVVLEKGGRFERLYAQNVKSRGSARSDLLTVGGRQDFTPAVATHTEAITQFIRPNPIYEGDVLIGYEVYAGREAGVFSQLGLQPGDLITALDGLPVVDPKMALQRLEQLPDGVALTATVKRKGHTQTLSLDGAILRAALDHR